MKIVDVRDDRSLANVMRRRRFKIFSQLLGTLPRPVSVLDVGGEQSFWDRMGIAHDPGMRFLIANVFEDSVSLPNFSSVVADARNLGQFADGEFDIVFSNSVIEHVGTPAEQNDMAREIRRVGRRFFVQTPNRFFPLDPHFYFPMFQFLPLNVKIWLLTHLRITEAHKKFTKVEADELARGTRLVRSSELRDMFPGAEIRREKFLGLTKSFMVFQGWEPQTATAPTPMGSVL